MVDEPDEPNYAKQTRPVAVAVSNFDGRISCSYTTTATTSITTFTILSLF